jgi:hypothetical protein
MGKKAGMTRTTLEAVSVKKRKKSAARAKEEVGGAS